jgi:osmotically-inducible protein OsmY
VRRQNGFLALTAAFAFAVMSAGCDTTTRDTRDDAKDTAAAGKAEAKDEAAEAKAESREAAADAKKTAGNAGAAVDAATETIDVKTALMADASVDASDINVDTFHETKTVVLKGSVGTAAQKTEAGKIAAREAEGYKIENQLVVKPRS